jgi:hypothetical protein
MPSATLYALKRLLSMRLLVSSPEHARQFEQTFERLFELLSSRELEKRR